MQTDGMIAAMARAACDEISEDRGAYSCHVAPVGGMDDVIVDGRVNMLDAMRAALCALAETGAIEIFRIDRNTTIEARGEKLFAVVHRGEVLNRDGALEREPMPSSRSAMFVERTRYSFREALELAKALQ